MRVAIWLETIRSYLANEQPWPPVDRTPAGREGRMQTLAHIYAVYMSEDAVDGTEFDCAVFRALDEVRRQFKRQGK